MDTAKVVMLASSAGARFKQLPKHLQVLAESEEFWEGLEATPEEDLTAEQLEMLDALEIELPSSDGD